MVKSAVAIPPTECDAQASVVALINRIQDKSQFRISVNSRKLAFNVHVVSMNFGTLGNTLKMSICFVRGVINRRIHLSKVSPSI